MSKFIDTLKPFAIIHGNRGQVNPVLILAQGILESNEGKSELAVNANNLFGIKADTKWTGEIYAKDSKEWSAEKGWYSAVSNFRKYDSYEGCVIDLVEKYNSMPRYMNVLGQTDYRLVTQAVWEAGYATDPTYPLKLQSVIESRGLMDLLKGEIKLAKASDYLVALDWGHGPGTPGKETPFIQSLGRKIQEEEFNTPTVKYLDAELRRCGFRTLLTASESYDVPLTQRTNKANAARAHIFVSVHFNAMGNTFGYSTAKGFSAHIQEGSTTQSNAYKLAKLMIEELAKGTPQVNRGIVRQNLAVTRQTNMPAVLMECGFMDDPGEASLMLNKSFQQECAREMARAVCRYFGVPYVAGGEVAQVSNPTKNYLSYGDRSDAVVEMKKYLNQFGNYNLEMSDYFNAAAKRAVMDFQQKRGLTVDGIYGVGTKAEMNVFLKEPKGGTTKPDPQKEAETLVLNQRQREEMAVTFKFARTKGIFSSDQHEKKVLDGTMTVSEAIYLQSIISAAALNGGKDVR